MGAARIGRVLFDEAHSEAWTIRPELARTMQPAHPADSSYALAASALAERDFVVAANVDGPLDRQALERCDVLVIAHPSDPAWERTTGSGSPRLSAEELDAIERVRARRGRADRARRDRAGEVRQQPERAARALRPAPRERHRPGLRAPSRRAELDPRRAARRRARPRRRPARPGRTRSACTAPRRSRRATAPGPGAHPRDRLDAGRRR